jgi:hypothetical protein
MCDDVTRKRQQEYLETVLELFPDGDERLDLLCETTAKLSGCDFGSFVIATANKAFALGRYNLPERLMVGPRPILFDRTKPQEYMSVSEELSHGLYLDRQKIRIQYCARYPIMAHGLPLGGIWIGRKEPRECPLSESEWEGLRAAADLGQRILLRSEALKIQLSSLVNVIVS